MGALARLRDPVTLTVGAFAVHRLTRLATEDEVTAPLRAKFTGETGEGRLAYFVTCPWCVSIYVAAAWAALTVSAPAVAVPAGAALAWSSVTGLLASLE